MPDRVVDGDRDQRTARVDAAVAAAEDGLERLAEEFLRAVGSFDDQVRVAKALATLSDVAKRLSVERVQLARQRGLPWTLIGDVFGISRQSARERFG